MRIVFLDRKSIGEDINLEKFKELADVEIYDFSTVDEARKRTEHADFVITCKIAINEESIGLAKNIKMVCITGTGTNILDIDYLESKKIMWKNVSSYCTESVAQHTFSMLFYLLENLRFYDDYVRNLEYVDDTELKHFSNKFSELCGKTWGIIGLGEIGREVAKIASAFGANIIFYSTSGRNSTSEYRRVDFDDLLKLSDVISIHAPENMKTINLIDEKAFDKMSRKPIILNLGRGSIINENDLVDAIKKNKISAAGLDVISKEPMEANSSLMSVLGDNRLLITPHVAWASVEARNRVIDRIYGYLSDYIRETMEA